LPIASTPFLCELNNITNQLDDGQLTLGVTEHLGSFLDAIDEALGLFYYAPQTINQFYQSDGKHSAHDKEQAKQAGQDDY